MSAYRTSVIVAFLICLCLPAWAETYLVEHGGDTFVSGPQITRPLVSSGDTFVAARQAHVTGRSQGDLHVSGFDVSISADAAEDLYAVGASVVLAGSVGHDLSAAGFSVHVQKGSITGGNARLLGNTVTAEGDIAGALLIAGRDVILNGPVNGDARILAQTLSFGPDAVIAGTLTYMSQDPVAVPERVAPPTRVVFEKTSGDMFWEEFEDMHMDMPIFPTFVSVVFGFIILLLFFIFLGVLMLGLLPRRLEKMRLNIARAPGQTFLAGVIGLSLLFGMVPITALTVVGLPFVPIVVLLIIVAWTLGYALGAYGIAMKVWTGLSDEDEPGNMTRILVFAVAIIAISLLNFIPFVGWVVNYTLVLLGIGAMTHALFQYLIGNSDVALDVDMKPIEK